MKRLLYSLLAILSIVGCAEIDNYEPPNSTLRGNIKDAATGINLQLQQGDQTRIRLDEMSWSSTAIPLYLNVKQDGSYMNTKIFAGQYKITPVDGPFYPFAAGGLAFGEAKDVSGETVVDFAVTPYLNLTWVSPPAETADNKITATFRFTRNPVPAYAPAGTAFPDLSDYQLFISTTQFVGNNNFDANIVTAVKPATNAMAGTDITVASNLAMKYSAKYFVRVGVRVKDPNSRYIYTDIKQVDVTL